MIIILFNPIVPNRKNAASSKMPCPIKCRPISQSISSGTFNDRPIKKPFHNKTVHVDSPHVNIPNTESDIPTIILENRIVLNTLLQCGIGWAFIRIGVYSSEKNRAITIPKTKIQPQKQNRI